MSVTRKRTVSLILEWPYGRRKRLIEVEVIHSLHRVIIFPFRVNAFSIYVCQRRQEREKKSAIPVREQAFVFGSES